LLFVCDRAKVIAESRRIEPSVVVVALGLAAAPEGARQLTLSEARERIAREVVPLALGRASGNLSKAAMLLGISRPTLYGLRC
jgi:two-component system, NtrC family, response regulator